MLLTLAFLPIYYTKLNLTLSTTFIQNGRPSAMLQKSEEGLGHKSSQIHTDPQIHCCPNPFGTANCLDPKGASAYVSTKYIYLLLCMILF